MTIQSNIWKLAAIKILRWFLVVIAVLVPFFQSNGLSMSEILLIQAAFSFTIVLFEIPSGYFSDVIGRKTTMIIGCLLSFGGLLFYAFSYNFWGFLVGEVILASGASFISGTDSAMLYDTLLALDRKSDYTKIEGRLMSFGNFSEGIAGIIGGLLAAISIRYPLYAEATVMFFTIPLALSLVEPERSAYKNEKGNFRGIWEIVVYSLHGHAELKWLIIYGSLVHASTLTMVWFIQPYLTLCGVEIAWFGVVWAILQFSVGVFSFSAHNVERRLGRKASLMMLIALSVCAYVLVATFQALWAIAFILIFYLVRGMASPVFNGYINQLISSDKRATVLSVQALGMRFIFSTLGPLLGWITDMYSLSAAFYTAAVFFGVSGFAALLLMKKNGAL